MKTIRTRIEELEKQANNSGGQFYFVFEDGDSYELLANAADVTENVQMNKKQFDSWHNSRLENDVIYIVSERKEN